MKKLLIGAALIASAVLLLSGCSDPGTGSSAVSTTWQAENTNLKGTTLTLWAAQASNKIPVEVVSGFEKLTGASVKVVTIPDPYEQTVLTKIATGDKPDLAFWSPVPAGLTSLNAKTNLLPLDGAPWLSKVDPKLRDVTGILDKTRYSALISTPAVLGVYYNKAVLAKANVTVPAANIPDLIKDADLVKASGVTPFYEMGGEKWGTQWFWQMELADAGANGLWDRVNANKEKFTDPTIQGAINYYADLINKGYYNSDIKTATFDQQGDALLSGKAGMVTQINAFANLLTTKASKSELDSKIGFFPVSEKGNLAITSPDQTNAVVAFKTGDAKKEAASRQFLSYWLGGGYKAYIANQKIVSIEPSVQTPSSVSKLQQDVSAAFAHSVGGMQASAVANTDVYLYLSDMIAGTMTPAQVGAASEAQFVTTAKAQGVPGF